MVPVGEEAYSVLLVLIRVSGGRRGTWTSVLRYDGGMQVEGDASHKVGLRLIIYTIATTAAKYGLAMEPLFGLSIDFYTRVFIRVKKSMAEVKNIASKSMLRQRMRRLANRGFGMEVRRKGLRVYKVWFCANARGGEGGVSGVGLGSKLGGPMCEEKLHEEGYRVCEGAVGDAGDGVRMRRGILLC